MIQVMLLALMLVMTSGAAFYIGGENEGPVPTLPRDTYMMLTYEVEGVFNGTPVNGSFGVQMLTGGIGSGFSYSWPYNITGNLGPLATLPGFIFGLDCFLVRSTMDTPWGEKQGMLFIGQTFNWNGSQGVVFTYKGVDTGLAYRIDLVAPEAKATYSLAAINITGMEDLDLSVRNDLGDLTAARHLEDGYSTILSGSGTWGLLEALDDESYRISLNATDYAFMVFGEQEILSMAAGGDFSPVGEWSMNGNGSREFVITDQMVFFYLDPIVGSSGADGLLVITML
ncbi:MAG TPA: hypothetical protein PKM11_08055 [Methanomassiliicoccales archaeon]|nr:hypothetical protein [Methanomassiliicoccales archaeon]